MQNGHRASKIIGAGVYSDANTQIGTVDDLMITPDEKVALAILSVGGFIGLGGKLVAVPIGQLQQSADGKLMLPGATKDSLNAQPNFVY
jgi:sporulation protein YlmC with PRC-barrel domain